MPLWKTWFVICGLSLYELIVSSYTLNSWEPLHKSFHSQSLHCLTVWVQLAMRASWLHELCMTLSSPFSYHPLPLNLWHIIVIIIPAFKNLFLRKGSHCVYVLLRFTVMVDRGAFWLNIWPWFMWVQWIWRPEENWSHWWLWATMWVQGLEPRSFAWAPSTSNSWAVSPILTM